MKKIVILILITALLSAAGTYKLMKGGTSARAADTHAEADTHGHDKETAETDAHGHDAEAEEADAHGHDEEAEEAHGPAIAGIKTAPVTIGEAWEMVTAAGKVGPNQNRAVKISPRIAGKIGRVFVNAGDVVRQGQALATLSSVDLAQARAAYRQAAAKVQAAREAYNRQVKLAQLGAFSKRPVEEARSEYTTAQGELAQAKSELARSESELAQCVARLSRSRELYKDQIISRQDLESAEAEFKRDSADVDAAQAKIQQAEAQLTLAKAYKNREEKMLGENVLVSKELQAAKAELTSAEVELRGAADTIRVLGAAPGGAGDAITISSPLSGRVVTRSVNLGEVVDQSSVLFTVMDLAEVWIEASVYEKDLASIRRGQGAEIRVTSFPNEVFTGRVIHISDVLDHESRAAKVRCAVANSSGLLKPEMFATVNLITRKRGSALLIPKEAVLDDAGQKTVYVACADCEEDKQAGKSVCGTYDKKVVELGPAHNGHLEVRSGLERKDQVVTVGAYQLKTALGSGTLEAGCADGH